MDHFTVVVCSVIGPDTEQRSAARLVVMRPARTWCSPPKEEYSSVWPPITGREVIIVVRFKFALVVGTMLVLLFSSAATATADEDAANRERTTVGVNDNSCCNRP